MEVTAAGEPQGLKGAWVQAEDVNWGDNRRGNGSRSSHAAWGAEVSGGIWRVAGGVDV